MAIWALQWRSCNILDGETRHIIHNDCLPVLFRTREDARVYASRYFAYIKHREDLRREPHGWRMPRPVRVTITTRDEREPVEETA